MFARGQDRMFAIGAVADKGQGWEQLSWVLHQMDLAEKLERS